MAAPVAEASAIARKSGSNFYLSFFSLPKDQREAITAVYAFCREVDDAVDDPREIAPAESVARWRQEIENTFDGRPTLPLTRSLSKAIERFSLSRAYFDGILTGVEMDLSHPRYATVDALEGYCYHVAGEVGLLCMEIFGYRSERLKQYAVKLGLAFQWTNILRDVATDAKNGRIYLPQEDLRRFGVEESWLLDETVNHQTTSFRNLMAFEASRARGYYRDAAVLPKPAEWPSLRAAEIMRAIYEEVLNRIEAKQFNVYAERVRVPTSRKLWLVAKTWWQYR